MNFFLQDGRMSRFRGGGVARYKVLPPPPYSCTPTLDYAILNIE